MLDNMHIKSSTSLTPFQKKSGGNLGNQVNK